MTMKKINIKNFNIISTLLVAFLFAGCASSGHIKKLDPIIYDDSTSKVVFYRDNTSDRPTTVMVQDRIIGVLKADQYLEASVCSGQFPIRISTRIGDKMVERSGTMALKDKSTGYVFVNTSSSVATPQVVSVNSEDDIIKGKDEGTYVVNRFLPDCRYIDIAADVLFAFNSSKLRPEGEAALNKLVEVLQSKAVATGRMIVEGHTDRIGSNAYNDRLSLARANTVANYLKAHGIQTPLTPKGMGKRAPVTDGCYGVTPKAKLAECLQPDRRVRIQLLNKQYNPVQ